MSGGPERPLRAVLLAALLQAGATTAWADARLAGIFGDHMVLQRGMPIAVWGRAAPGETVQVQFRHSRARAVADADGRWALRLPAAPAGGPHTLTLQAGNRITLQDVLVGEVWLCAGQSNMEWPLRLTHGADQALAEADLPQLRHVAIAHRASVQAQADGPPARWQASTPATAGDFSAVGFHFARALQRALGVPVGLVHAAWGGTHLETWLPRDAALADAGLAPWVLGLPASDALYPAWATAQGWAAVQRWQPGLQPQPADSNAWADPALDDTAWQTLAVPGPWEAQGLPGFDGTLWLRRSVELDAAQAAGAATLHLGAVDDCDETWVNGQRVGGFCGWDVPRHHTVPAGVLQPGRNTLAVKVTDTGGAGGPHGDPAALQLETAAGTVALAGRWRARPAAPLQRESPHANDAPTLAFNGLLQPLLPLRLGGVLWYQGESNVPRAARHAQALRRLITGWRQQWGQPALPFLQVQLASYLPLAHNSLAGSAWAELREAQALALDLPHTGMAVAIDVGDADDIHPRNKRAVGERLARLALRQVFGRPVVAQGPVLHSLQHRGAVLALRYRRAGGALALRAGSGPALQGFAVAGADGRFHAAQARLAGQWVLLRQPQVPRPVAVRYGWVDNAGEANLVNAAGLPAAPMRSDHWPLTTAGRGFTP